MVCPVSGPQRTCRWLSPLGPMLLAAEGDWLTGAWFEGQKYFGRTLAAGRAEGDAPVLTLISVAPEEEPAKPGPSTGRTDPDPGLGG